MQVNKYHGPYEDNGAADPLRRGEERTPEPGDGVPGSVKVIAAGTAIGGRWGSIMAITAPAVPAGVAASGGWVAVGSALGAGLAASAVAGFGVGTIIGEFEPIRAALTDIFEWGHTLPDGQLHQPGKEYQNLKPIIPQKGELKDTVWEFDFDPTDGPSGAQAWFYVGDGSNNPINGDSFLSDLNHDGIEVYSDPFAAMDAAQLAGLVGIMDELHIVYEMR